MPTAPSAGFRRAALATVLATFALIVLGGVVGGAIIGVFAEAGPRILGIHLLSVAAFSAATVLGLWLTWAILRSGRI